MSDERLERLTRLAQKAWPELLDVRVRLNRLHDEWPDASVVYEAPHLDGDVSIAEIMHPTRALDALESALRVLAGEDSDAEQVRQMFAANAARWSSENGTLIERAEDAEARLAELRATLTDYAGRWDDWADVPLPSACNANSLARQFAHELRVALDVPKETP